MRYSRKNKINWSDPKVISIAVGIGILMFTFGKSIINRLSSGLSFLNAKKDQDKLVNETLNNPVGVRYTYVQGIVDAIHSEINNGMFSDTDEKMIVSEMNKLNSPEEVIFASNYYKNKHGKSLKTVLKSELNSSWRDGTGFLGKIVNPNAAGGSYSNLSDVVQKNLL